MPRTQIVIMGLPSSGNGLLSRLVQHLYGSQDRQCNVSILHGFNGCPKRGVDYAILPVRCPECRRRSKARRSMKPPEQEDLQERWKLFQWIAEYQIPLHCVSYEALVHDPDAVGRDIAAFLELPWPGWPEPIRDENAKYGKKRA